MDKLQLIQNVATYFKTQKEFSSEILLENKIDFKLNLNRSNIVLEVFTSDTKLKIENVVILNKDIKEFEIRIVPQNDDWQKTKSLESLDNSINKCLACELGSSRKNFIFGSGNFNADIMIIAESPSTDDDDAGKPIVGRAGELLTQIIEAIELKRNDLYIVNIIKCKTPSNRRPTENEVDKCIPYLKKQIELIQPKFILALGIATFNSLLKSNEKMSEIRGKVHLYQNCTMLATYHPSDLLRNPALKKETWQDVKQLKKLYTEYLKTK